MFRIKQYIEFIGKQYPAYFWNKPSVWRLLLLPFLLVYLLFKK